MGFFLVTIAIAFGILTSLPVIAHRFLSVIFVLPFIMFTALDLHKKKKLSKAHVLEIYIVSAFLLYQILKKESSLFYHFLSKIAGGFSALIGALIGKPISMGITYSAIDVVVLFLIALIAAALIYKQISLKKTLLFILSILCVWGFYIGLWTFLAESSLLLGLNLLEPVTGPLDYRSVLFAMLLASYMCFYRKHAKEDAGEPLNKITKLSPAVLLALCMIITAISSLSSKAPVKSEVKQIVFLDTGIDFSVPEHERYGLEYVGMFGILPHYLNQKDYRCLTVDNLDKPLLGETNILVVFNPVYTLDDNTLSDIWDFVEHGGSVLAVGDHTGEEQVRLPLNAILQPAGIFFNFDSAIPFKNLWAEDYSLQTSPVFSGVNGRQIQVVVGASLNIGFRARPLVIGKEGFSDFGDMENITDGYLGDMRFNRGERIGDLILAAEASYGKGKFIAFGDTTLFQNTVIPYSYPVIDNIFAYLSSSSPQHNVLWEDDGFFQASCVIDASHLEVFARDKSVDAMDGLIACSMRAGFMPYMNQTEPLAEILQAESDVRLAILIEPAKSFSKKELHALEQFMEAGGNVILCAGYDSPKASKELAARFGFAFESMPIGRIAPDSNPKMAFWNACPILYQGVAPQNSGGGTESLMEIWGNSTMAYKPIGTGGLYIFADPDFLKNKNLESVDTYREGNVRFLDDLLTNILKGRR